MTEVLPADEAGAGEVALVAEDAVQFQRMADGFMDLQDHLVRQQQQVARTAGCVRCQQQLQRLVGDARGAAGHPQLPEHFGAALARQVGAAEAAALAVVAVAGGHAHLREHAALSTAQAGPCTVEVDLLVIGEDQAQVAVHQPAVLRDARCLAEQPVEPVRRLRLRLCVARHDVIGQRLRHRLRLHVQQVLAGQGAGNRLGPLQRVLQAALTDVAGRRIGLDARDAHREHGAAVQRE